MLEYTQLINKYRLNKYLFTQRLFRAIVLDINFEDINILVKSKYFKSKTIYDRFINQFKGHDSFIVSNDDSNIYFGLELSRDIKLIIQKDKENKVFKSISQQVQEQDEEQTIENVFRLDEFLLYIEEKQKNNLINLNNEQKLIIEKYKQYNVYNNNTTYYVADENINFSNIFVVNNKEFKYCFLPNPLIGRTQIQKGEEKSIFNQSYSTKILKLRIKVLKLSTNKVKGLTLVTKYNYICPVCGDNFTKLPYQLATTIKHPCPGLLNNKDQQVFSNVDKNSFTFENFQILHLYDFEIVTQKSVGTTGLAPKFVLYANDNNISPGTYDVEVKIQQRKLSYGQSENAHNMIYLISKKKIKPEIFKELIVSGEDMAKNLKIPYVKLLDILQSIRNVYSEYVDEEITNQGMWLQLCVLISGLARVLFNYRYIATSVIANKSLSKTYTATRIGIMIDPMYYFSHSSDDISKAGFAGGINNNKEVNGKAISIFEAGVVTVAGLCVLDEASPFYITEELNLALKSLFENVLSIKKIGGNEVPQNYTPILLSNFSYHDSEYKNMVKKIYIKIRRFKLHEKIDEKKLEQKLNAVDYYRPLEVYVNDYKDKALADAITQARVIYEKQKHIDWKTGGRIESGNRIFFDVVVDNRDKHIADGHKIDTSYTNLSTPEGELLPLEEFQHELLLKFKTKNINLAQPVLNSTKIKKQLKMLQKDIARWLFKDGKGNSVFHSLTNGNVKIDPKINNVLFNVCMVVQLVEDINSDKLTNNVKKFLEILLLKNKRGLSVDEYDFKTNITKYNKINFNISNLTLQMIEVDELAARDKLRKEVEREIKKNDVEISSADITDDSIDKMK